MNSHSLKRPAGVYLAAFVALCTLCFALASTSAAQSGVEAIRDVSKQTVIAPSGKQVTAGESNADSKTTTKVTFLPGEQGVVIIETADGEKLRIDTTAQTIARLSPAGNAPATNDSAAQPPTDVPAAKAEAASAKKKNDDYDFALGQEPYDYRVVNIPTAKYVPKGTFNMVFTHRFTQTLQPIRTSARGLFGLDSLGIASFGLTYGITDKLYASAYRSPLCQRGMCKVIEVGLGYNFISQKKGSPVAAGVYASVEGNDNFTEEFTYNIQAKFSARAGKRVYLFFAPAVHLNANGQRRFDPRASEFFPPAQAANDFRQPAHGASFGFGASVLITRDIVALFDFVPRTGFKLGQVSPVRGTLFGPVTGFTVRSEPSLGFGIQRNIGQHAFALTFSNTQATTTSRYNSSNLFLSPKKFTLGFNLSRRF